jgi:predicted transcriptional regulator
MSIHNSKSVTVRLPAALHSKILKTAEATNSNIAEATRNCLADHFNRIKLEDQLDTINSKLDLISKTLAEV